MVMQHSKAVIDFNLNNIENVPKFCAKFYSYFETPIFENYIDTKYGKLTRIYSKVGLLPALQYKRLGCCGYIRHFS